MKLLVVIGLAVLLLVLLYWRLRPYLRLLRNFLNAIRQFQQVTTGRETKRDPVPNQNKLVQCDACGTWVPGTRTVASPAGVFCSRECANSKFNQRRSEYRPPQTGTDS